MNNNQQNYEIAIGQKVSELLHIKVNKTTGKVNTTWVNKTIQGLGACIIQIFEVENNQARINAILDEHKQNYDMGMYTTGEYNTLVAAVK